MKEKKFVPYEKLSKKKKKELNKAKRNTWGDFDPTTRVESLGYDRQKEKRKTKKAVDEDLKDI